MSSIIEGYNYDIFISYRQKDNKGDRWVSEFVEALKTELESTFKEEINVYFDINPHDGLLETHDVDASLKDKLKCLVFIPIISRTYCDPKSFAWEHEFKPFVELASNDQFGLKVKIPNGNVTSRVLPIRIHDLDIADIKECELVLGGVLRGIEFIYKEPGVNKPLTSDDDEKKNLNGTRYRIQVNKVANAIKEVITAIEQYSPQHEEVSKEVYHPVSVPPKNSTTTIIIGSLIVLALIILGFFLIPKLIKPKGQLEKSIAVLPFINDSPDTTNLYFCNGMMEDILNDLVKIEDLDVKSRTDVEPYREVTKSVKEIGRELRVANILEGSIRKQGNRFKISLQLINAESGFHIWSDTFEGEYSEEIWTIQNNIAQQVAIALKAKLTRQDKDLVSKFPTNNIQAYDFYIRGRDEMTKYWRDHDPKHMKESQRLLDKALEIDPGFEMAIETKVWTYFGLNNYDSVLIFANKLLSINPNSARGFSFKGYTYDRTQIPDSAIKNYLLAINNYSKNEIGVKSRDEFYLGQVYCVQKHDYRTGLSWIQKSLEREEWASVKYFLLGDIFCDLGDYDRTNRYYQKSFEFDVIPVTIERFATVLIYQSKFREALNFLDTICRQPESLVSCNRSRFLIYISQKEFGMAEQYYNQFINAGGTPDYSDSIKLAYMYKATGRQQISLTILKNCQRFLERKAIKKPDNLVSFNLSLIHAIMGRKEEAIRRLSESFDLGLRDGWPDLLESYPVFDNIRDSEEFKSVIKHVWDEKAAIREQVNEMVKREEINL